MPANIPIEQLRRVMQAVRTRPRYRARMVRQVILAEAGAGRDYGCSLDDARREFWARYDYTPSRVLMSQQAQLLKRDGRVVRVGHGQYRLAAAPSPAPDPFS